MPAARISYGSSVYLANPDTGAFVALPDSSTNATIGTVHSVPAKAVSAAEFEQIRSTCERVRQQVVRALLDTVLTLPAGETDTVETALMRVRRHEKAWRSFSGVTPV